MTTTSTVNPYSILYAKNTLQKSGLVAAIAGGAGPGAEQTGKMMSDLRLLYQSRSQEAAHGR